MAIPKYDEITLPLLQFLADGEVHSMADTIEMVEKHFRLTPEECNERLPGGKMTYVRSRTGWARFHLVRAGLAEQPREGHAKITPAGLKFLKTKPKKITRAELMLIPQFKAFMLEHKKSIAKALVPGANAEAAEVADVDPEEQIAQAYAKLRATLAAELLERVKAKRPGFFEQLVVDLLLAMGYGGSRAEAGTVTKASGDGGIDGVINEDRLGLDAVYIQAKRWKGTVGVNELRSFVGALSAHKAHKGVFITTSDFAKGARDFIEKVGQKIVLIDGARLAELMIDYGVGVQRRDTYELKRADEDYFAET